MCWLLSLGQVWFGLQAEGLKWAKLLTFCVLRLLAWQVVVHYRLDTMHLACTLPMKTVAWRWKHQEGWLDSATQVQTSIQDMPQLQPRQHCITAGSTFQAGPMYTYSSHACLVTSKLQTALGRHLVLSSAQASPTGPDPCLAAGGKSLPAPAQLPSTSGRTPSGEPAVQGRASQGKGRPRKALAPFSPTIITAPPLTGVMQTQLQQVRVPQAESGAQDWVPLVPCLGAFSGTLDAEAMSSHQVRS